MLDAPPNIVYEGLKYQNKPLNKKIQYLFRNCYYREKGNNSNL